MDIDLLKTLISIDTTTGKNREEIVSLLEEAAKERGLEAKRVVDEKGILNLLISKPGKGKKVLFITHYDVVPPGDGWTRDPFEPEIVNGKLFGRGATDDKSAIVAVLDALAKVDDLAVNPVLVVAGAEETGESGPFMKKLDGDFAVVIDSGPLPTIGASGVLKWTVTVKGKQVHSAYPFLGKNALYGAAKIVLFVEQFHSFAEKFLISTYPAVEHYNRLPVRAAATILHSGSVWNIIPSRAEVHISIRTVPDINNDAVEEAFISLLKKFMEENNIVADIRKDIDMKAWASRGKEVENFFEIYKEVTGTKVLPAVELGGTDGVHFADRMPVVQFGTIRKENNPHGPNEFVYLKDVEMVERVITELLKRGV